MSTVVASRELSTTANIIAGGLTMPVPQSVQLESIHSWKARRTDDEETTSYDPPPKRLTSSRPRTNSLSAQSFSLQVVVPDFQIHLEMPLEDVVSNMSAGKVLLRATVDEEVAVILTVAGRVTGDQFQIEGVYFNTEAPFESARASFVASTLHALFSLSKAVNLRVPELEINLDLEFGRPLLDISQMLRQRQLEYRIMLIERATGYEFMLPSDLTAEQVRDVTLIYYAIVHRTFVWPVNSVTIFFSCY